MSLMTEYCGKYICGATRGSTNIYGEELHSFSLSWVRFVQMLYFYKPFIRQCRRAPILYDAASAGLNRKSVSDFSMAGISSLLQVILKATGWQKNILKSDQLW